MIHRVLTRVIQIKSGITNLLKAQLSVHIKIVWSIQGRVMKLRIQSLINWIFLFITDCLYFLNLNLLRITRTRRNLKS